MSVVMILVKGSNPPKKPSPALFYKRNVRKKSTLIIWMGDRFMNDKKKEQDGKNVPSPENPQPLKVSKVVFDEATGTVTLTLATEEEIAEDERLKKEREKKE